MRDQEKVSAIIDPAYESKPGIDSNMHAKLEQILKSSNSKYTPFSLLSISKVVKLIGLSRNTFLHYLKDKKIHPITIGTRPFIPLWVIFDWQYNEVYHDQLLVQNFLNTARNTNAKRKTDNKTDRSVANRD